MNAMLKASVIVKFYHFCLSGLNFRKLASINDFRQLGGRESCAGPSTGM